jgi:HB1, ASXL, restriction endonuclease HTH domain
MKKHKGFTNREVALLNAWDKCNRPQIDDAFEARVLEAIHKAGRRPCEHELDPLLAAKNEEAVAMAMVEDAAKACLELRASPVTGLLCIVEEILRETAVPMSVREIVEQAGARLPVRSKTPDTAVARDLSMHIKREGERSIFVRTSPGRYTLRTMVRMAALPPSLTALPPSLAALLQRRLTHGGHTKPASDEGERPGAGNRHGDQVDVIAPGRAHRRT